MPARKPSSLIERHETTAEKADRDAQETAMRPKGELPKAAPARLKNHAVAAETWRRLMRMWGEVEGEIATKLDYDLLIDYCLLVEQLGELDTMRKKAYEAWLDLAEANKRLKAEGEDREDDAAAMAIEVVGAFDAIVKLDGRADRKRDMLFKLRQSLYLTPRSRAGVAPKKKEQELPDEFERFLDGVE